MKDWYLHPGESCVVLADRKQAVRIHVDGRSHWTTEPFDTGWVKIPGGEWKLDRPSLRFPGRQEQIFVRGNAPVLVRTDFVW